MQADGFNITVSVIEKMKSIFRSLPREEREGCKICDEKLTNIVKLIEAEAQVSNREACRFVGAETGKKDETVRKAVNRVQGSVGTNVTSVTDSAKHIDIAEKVAEKVAIKSVTKSQAIEEVAKECGITPAAARGRTYREQKKYADKQMFNKTDIEWCDTTWNPVTGCKHGCSYCYAADLANRKLGVYKDVGFEPHLHEPRLKAPENMIGKGSCFVVSMGDLFGEWVPEEWILKVIEAIKKCNGDYLFYFLTKNPKRYLEFSFPDNCWLGASASTQKQMDNATYAFSKVEKNRFVSCEPLQSMITIPSCVDWCIIGPQTNPIVQPKWEWVRHIINTTDIPLFFKPALAVPKWTPLEKIK